MLSKLKKLYIRTIYISKLTNVKLKKLRIVMSVVFSNISVGLEILIIIIFSTLLTDQVSFENKIILQTIDLFIDNLYLLLVIIFLMGIFKKIQKQVTAIIPAIIFIWETTILIYLCNYLS